MAHRLPSSKTTSKSNQGFRFRNAACFITLTNSHSLTLITSKDISPKLFRFATKVQEIPFDMFHVLFNRVRVVSSVLLQTYIIWEKN